MTERVVLHVGCPKTGTTGIQHQLFLHADELGRQGFAYPHTRPDEHFLAAVDVLEIPWGNQVSIDAVDAWDTMAAAARASTLDFVISHELLARATPTQIDRVVTSFGDADVSVVITARDLGRLIPAEYQEHLKYGNVMTYRTFLDRLRDPAGGGHAGELARLTWSVQDVPAIAERWAAGVGTDHVTLVTVPPAGAPRDELLRRFATVVGFDPLLLLDSDDDEARENRSLGAVEVAWLRRFNEVNTREDPEYGAFIRDRLITRFAREAASSLPLRLPPAEFGWVHDRAQTWVGALRTAGYPVVGDLDELLPVETSDDVVDPDQIPDAALFDVGARVLIASLDDYEDLVASMVPPPPPPLPTVPEVVKGRVVHRLERGAMGQGVLRVWRSRHWISRST